MAMYQPGKNELILYTLTASVFVLRGMYVICHSVTYLQKIHRFIDVE